VLLGSDESVGNGTKYRIPITFTNFGFADGSGRLSTISVHKHSRAAEALIRGLSRLSPEMRTLAAEDEH
jgi:hypothetical protein